MLNPMKLYFKDGKSAEVGDPFVMRFNGTYYLYPSTCYNKNVIYCFTSKDLINWSNEYIVATDVLPYAYAPEVIYHNGDFFLCTSPSGNGHYIYKSKSPLGPFEKITDNISNMIDGSFALDSNFKLKFYRADHHGIACSDMDDHGHCSNRMNLNAPLKGWTEGPSVTYRNGRYYLTYCANHLESKGYRIAYSVSKEIDNHFEVPTFNPLLISTCSDFNSLGHSSNVLAPDLDGYYIVYHHLKMIEDENGRRHTRDFGIDRLHFNGSMLTTSCSYFENEDPQMPDLYEDISKSHDFFEKVGKMTLSKKGTSNKFTAEFNFNKEKCSLILGYKDENNYSYISLTDYQLMVFDYINGKSVFVKRKALPIKFDCLRTVRIINDKMAEILIDNVPILSVKSFNEGKIGYSTTYFKGLHFTAFSNHALGSSDLLYPNVLPGVCDCIHDLNQKEYSLDLQDDINYVDLKKDDVVSFNVLSKEDKTYHISILCNCESNAKLLVNDKEVNILPMDNEYKYVYKEIGFIDLKKNDRLDIKVLDGNISYKALIVSNKENEEVNEENLKLLNVENLSAECDFEFEEFTNNSLFGLVFNATEYSNHPCNPTPSFIGYIVGFRNSLAVVDAANYGCERVYDIPRPIKTNQIYHLKVSIKDSVIDVYLDNDRIIHTTLPYPYTFGLGGIYKNEFAKVKISNYKEVK